MTLWRLILRRLKFPGVGVLVTRWDIRARQPKTLTKTHRHDGVLYVAGRPPGGSEEVHSDVMFVATAVQEEEATEVTLTGFGHRIRQAPEYLRGPIGTILQEVGLRAGTDAIPGVDVQACYYTALVKHLLPRAVRNKPPTKVLRWGMPVLEDEIRRVKPKIIVCLGKPVFDMLADEKISFDDAHGGWFWSEKAGAHLYLMQSPHILMMKPELQEMFRVDLAEVARKIDILRFGDIRPHPINIEVVRDMGRLVGWAQQMIHSSYRYQGVDCEWHGNTHVDGQLRSLQLAWTGSDCAYFRFRDERNQFVFEMGPDFPEIPGESPKSREIRAYRAIGAALSPYLDRPDVFYYGHHYAADAPWLSEVLGLQVYGKLHTDTEFLQQCVDESSELGLERGIAMKYTTFGRYDIPLALWKRKNKALCEDGYGFIPDDILIPYACFDVLVLHLAVPIIRRRAENQGLTQYYDTIFRPFTSDVFVQFAIVGLPMDIERMDELRELFNYAKCELDFEFKEAIHEEAKGRLLARLIEFSGLDCIPAVTQAIELSVPTDPSAAVDVDTAWDLIKPFIPLDQRTKTRPFLDHLVASKDFNIRSSPDMRRWLFEVCGMTPVKSTNNKAKGMPSMDWQKVLQLPPDKQKLYTPAADKQTLQILASQLPLVDKLLDLNVVGNLCKAFLKEPEWYFDEDAGEEVKEEAGLHKWLCSDGRVHGQFSTTETGRPRGWRPNSLNWPSYVNERIGRAMVRVIRAAAARAADHPRGTLPESLRKWTEAKDEKDFPSIRSLVCAPAGWCLVESDYQTAEMVGLAMISGDKKLIRLLTDRDPEWALTLKGEKVRVGWAPTDETGIPVMHQRDEFLMAVWKDGELIRRVTDADLARNKDGTVKHAKFDIHWSLAERVYAKPREVRY